VEIKKTRASNPIKNKKYPNCLVASFEKMQQNKANRDENGWK
jgi:hypothetical protein